MQAGEGVNAEFQVLRTLGIVCIVIANIPLNLFFWRSSLGQFEVDYWSGNCGVDIFLALSGYVVTRSLQGRLAGCDDPVARMRAVTTYYLRRFWRLMPALCFWVTLPVVLGLIYNETGAFHTFDANLGAAETSLLCVNNLWFGTVAGVKDASVLFTLWPISLDQQFYLILPAVLVFMPRGVLPLAVLALVWQFVTPTPDMVVRTGALGVGVLLATVSRHPAYVLMAPHARGGSALLRWGVLLATMLVLGALQSDLLKWIREYAGGVSAIGCGALVYAASLSRGYLTTGGSAGRVASYVGDRALSIGLVHVPMFAVVRESYVRLRLPPMSATFGLAALQLCAGLACTWLAADLTFRFIEAPATRYGRRLVLQPVRGALA